MLPKLVKIILLLVLGFQFQGLKAQEMIVSNVPDPRLNEALGDEQIQFLTQNNPDLIGYYNYFLDNAFVLIQHPAEKVPGIIANVPLLELKNASLSMDKPDVAKGAKGINIFKYDFHLDQNNSTQYRLDNSGIIIVFYPAKVITANYNKARNK